MKKILVFAILFSGLFLAWACNDKNNNPTNPTNPPGGGGGIPTMTPTGTITPGAPTFTPTSGGIGGTPTFTPTFAVPPPTWLHNYVTTAHPNAMVLVGSTLSIAEGEPGVTSLGEYTVVGSGNTATLAGGTAGNLIVVGVPTPGLTPPWQGTTIVLTDPVGIGYSSYTYGLYPGNTYSILDASGGGATLYQQDPFDASTYSNYTNGYSGILFNSPQGFTVDGLGNHYVADAGNGQIEAFGVPSGGGPPYTPAWEWYYDGHSTSFPFKQPCALACDSNNNLWVGDKGYNPSKVGEFAPIGALGSGGASFIGVFNTVSNCLVSGLAVDQSASCNGVPGPCVYVADAGNYKVEEYTSTGVLLRVWTIPISMTEYDTFVPSSIILYGNPVSNIIVADVGNNEIQLFGP